MNYFVTGTDTGVGKTLISCAMLHAFSAQGKRVAGMKPVAAGCNADEKNKDALELQAAGNVAASYELTNPYCLAEAIAPHIAARNSGVEIRFSRISGAYEKLAAQADVVIVEGAGGLLVPFNDGQTCADLAKTLGLPLVLVVGIRLGCLNHALLTVEAAAARGLPLAGWVANVIERDMACVQENIAALQQRIDAPLLGVVPYTARADARVVAGQLDLGRMEI